MAAQDYGLITEIRPPYGWYFIQPLKDDSFRIEGPDYPGLVRLVTLYRISAGLPLGDVEHDICLFTRERSPMNDFWKGRVYPPIIDPNQPISARLTQWLASMKLARVKIVSKAEAKTRADICENCPQNIKWKSKCAPCNEAIESDGRIVRRFAASEHDGKLNACRLHSVLLSCAIFIDRAFLPPRNEKSPSDCWMPTNE